jgi:hypothetical protein
MNSDTNKRSSSSAWSRFGYGRFNKTMAKEFDQTGYGTPVPINPETITPEAAMIMDDEPVISAEDVEKYQEYIDNTKKPYEPSPKAEWLEEDIHVPSTETKREELYRIQESKRAAKIQVDQNIVLWAWLVAVGIAFVSSAIVSFNGITSVAEFVGLSATWMAGLFFFFIELMYLIFLVAYLVLASRVDDEGEPEKTSGALWGMIAFAAIAVGANAFHTLDYWDWDFAEPSMWAGIVLSVAAPLAIISASKMASRVVFARAITL